MKLKASLRNLARAARNSFLLIAILALYGCTQTTKQTYLKVEDIPKNIQDICHNEYKIDVISKLVGRTLWVYLPLENFLTTQGKPEKYVEKFEVQKTDVALKDGLLNVEYAIKSVPTKEGLQSFTFDKDAVEKVTNVLKVIRRAVFNIDKTQQKDLRIISFVSADIKNGIKVQQIISENDLRKYSYGFMSNGEFQHRTIQISAPAPELIHDKEGNNLGYSDITMDDFIALQIDNRIKSKFQKPEVGQNVNIDTEITKIVAYVVKIYNPKDLTEINLNNLLTTKKTLLNKKALSSKEIDPKWQ